MRGEKEGSERPRTGSRTPPAPTELDVFRSHYADVTAFTDALREHRCRRTSHFDAHLKDTIAVFQPVFAQWNMEILFLLYMQGARRFNALKRDLGGVSARVLTDKLRHLAEHGFVEREEGEDGGVAYSLTAHGATVARILHPLVFYLHNRESLGAMDAAVARAQP